MALSFASPIVDPTLQAARSTLRPCEALGWYSVSTFQHVMGAAIAATNPYPVIFSFRYHPTTTTNLLIVRRITVGFCCGTVAGAMSGDFNLYFARGFTKTDSSTGGVNMMPRLRTTMPTCGLASADVSYFVGTTIVPGTRTLDSQPLGYFAFAFNTNSFITQDIYRQEPHCYPLIVANNEGLVLNTQNGIAYTPGGAQKYWVSMEIAEVAAY